MADKFNIRVGGGDTATPLNVHKRINIIRHYICPGKTRVIDCGCGEGEYVRALSEAFHVNVMGIEYLSDKVKKAQSDPFLASHVIQGDLEAIQFADGSFDLAMLNEVLEHIPCEAKALAEIRRVMAPDGTLIVFSPNRWFPFETHGVNLKRSGRKVPPWVPFVSYVPVSLGNHFLSYWARNYWQGELSSLIENSGFTVVKRTWIWQTFENISGTQPKFIRFAKPLFRFLSNMCEHIPLIRRFGASQVIVAKRDTVARIPGHLDHAALAL